jgi:spoIIIJ-associated protein
MDKEKVISVISNILSLMGLTEDQIDIQIDEQENINIHLTVPKEQTGAYIGYHGDGLSSIRMIFSLVIFQRFSVWPKLHLNVNDYQQRKEETLQEVATTAAQKAIDLQREIIIPNLSSYERRIVHMYLEGNASVTTESRGEAQYRQMHIIPVAQLLA